jgi:hypothetical protein
VPRDVEVQEQTNDGALVTVSDPCDVCAWTGETNGGSKALSQTGIKQDTILYPIIQFRFHIEGGYS